ncbi:hypothetical protein [Faecalicatena contorta]|uniref:hypothetical protein n=1 Tax=Faecalicatena contorta TaxID=39482 RepID=UPI0018980C4F|nr:hypothetical protein [Faecalicatena contorta]
MKCQKRKILFFTLNASILIIAVVISSFLTRQSLISSNSKKLDDYIGTFSYGSFSPNDEKQVYLVIRNGEEKITYIMYRVIDETIISEGSCNLDSEECLELVNDNIFYYVIPTSEGYTLLAGDIGIHRLEKISDGAVTPQNLK